MNATKIQERVEKLTRIALVLDTALWTGKYDALGREKIEAKKDELLTRIEQGRYILRKRYGVWMD